jgi:hypothetical protein
MQRLEVSCAVRPIYGSLGAKGLWQNVTAGHRGWSNATLTDWAPLHSDSSKERFITPHTNLQFLYPANEYITILCRELLTSQRLLRFQKMLLFRNISVRPYNLALSLFVLFLQQFYSVRWAVKWKLTIELHGLRAILGVNSRPFLEERNDVIYS